MKNIPIPVTMQDRLQLRLHQATAVVTKKWHRLLFLDCVLMGSEGGIWAPMMTAAMLILLATVRHVPSERRNSIYTNDIVDLPKLNHL